ncbi:MAG TPA: flavodoxin family protein [Clostridiales bacterium]|nr:flavodoxin family protein [Clostridiales bacterium]
MKVFVLFSSPNKNGYTKKLLDGFFVSAPGNLSVDTVNLFDLLPKPCNDCKACGKENTCVFDDLDEVFDKMQNADVVIIATPVYHYNVPAPLKAVFDRTQRFYEAYVVRKEEPKRKNDGRGVLLTVSGRKAKQPVELIKKQTDRAFALLGINLAGSVHMGETDKGISDSEAIRQAEELGKKIFSK